MNSDMSVIKTVFYRGLRTIVPALLTIAILIWVVDSVELFFGFIIKLVIPEADYIPGMGAVFGLVLIFFVGVVMNALFIERIYDYFEELIQKIPLVKVIYKSIQDVMGLLDQDKGQKQGRAVTVELPGLGKVVGFITRDHLDEVDLGNEEDVCVYLPMSYQIGGYTLILPRNQVTPIEMSAQEAMSFAITAGISKKKANNGDSLDSEK